MCVYVCTCMCVCVYVCMCVCVYVCMCVSVHGCMCVWVYGCMGVWMYECMGVVDGGGNRWRVCVPSQLHALMLTSPIPIRQPYSHTAIQPCTHTHTHNHTPINAPIHPTPMHPYTHTRIHLPRYIFEFNLRPSLEPMPVSIPIHLRIGVRVLGLFTTKQPL